MILFDINNFPFRKDNLSYRYLRSNIINLYGKVIEHECNELQLTTDRFFYNMRKGHTKPFVVYDLP